MPVPKVPIQGDMKRLDQLASGLKKTGGTYGPTVQKTPAGRPAGTTGTPAPRASNAQPPVQITPDMEMSAKEVAIAEWARQYWTEMAAKFPSAWTQLYQQQAEAVAGVVHGTYYNSTPNFED